MTSDAVTAQYDWLTMIFLGADNDLFKFGVHLLTEAERVGSTDRVAVVAQHDPTDPDSATIRGQILRGRRERKNIGRTAGNAQAIIDFVNDVDEEFPAARKMLVLWDHGNGWQDVHTFDTAAANTARLPIEDALEGIHERAGIDVLCFDACLMAMIEIAYQLRQRVKFIVASENVVPADIGWPYDAILGTLATHPQLEPEQAATSIVNSFAGAYNGTSHPVTLSALKLASIDDTVVAIDRLARELIAACMNGSRERVLFARRYSQSFGNPDYIDLVSFCIELQRQLPGSPIADAAEEVRKSIATLVVGFARSSAASINAAHGVSIYFPDRPMAPSYLRLDFARTQTCMWANFLGMVTPPMTLERPLELPAEGIGTESVEGGAGTHRCPRGHSNVCADCRDHGAGRRKTKRRRKAPNQRHTHR